MNAYLWAVLAVCAAGLVLLTVVAWAEHEAERRGRAERLRGRADRPRWDWDEIRAEPGQPLIFARVLDHDREPPAGVYDFYQDGYVRQ